MAGSMSRSFRLLGASWTLLGKDLKLLLLPLTSLVIACVAAWAFWALGLVNFASERSSFANLIGLYLFYSVTAFVGICCNAVIVAVAMERLAGRPATVSDGWQVVRGRMGAVIRWALVSATVGVVMRIVQERLGLVGALATWIGNIVWSLATFFVVPVLLFEPVDVRGAIRRSARVFKERWGEQVTAELSIGAGFSVLLIPVFVVGVMLIVSVSPWVGGAVIVIGFVSLIVVSATLEQIFGAALYRYAVTGAVPVGMTADDFESIVKPRKGRLGRRSTKALVPPAPPPARPDV
jgi:Family of unknown function (DUF6159)